MTGWLLLWIIILVCLYTDLKARKIYNKVVMPGMVLGLVLNGLEDGRAGLFFACQGLLVGLGIFILPFLLGGIGAGDVKLLGAIGAIKGPLFAAWTGLGTGVAGGLIALVILIWRGQLISGLKRIGFSLFLLLGGARERSFHALDQRELSGAFPYGTAIALGVLAASWYKLS